MNQPGPVERVETLRLLLRDTIFWSARTKDQSKN